MSQYSDRIDELAQETWNTWRQVVFQQGWRLGPDLPSGLLTPWLLDSWSAMPAEGKAHFRQQVVLVLHAIDVVMASPKASKATGDPDGSPAAPSSSIVSELEERIAAVEAAIVAKPESVREMIKAVLGALDEAEWEPPKVRRSLEVALRSVVVLDRGDEPKRLREYLGRARDLLHGVSRPAHVVEAPPAAPPATPTPGPAVFQGRFGRGVLRRSAR